MQKLKKDAKTKKEVCKWFIKSGPNTRGRIMRPPFLNGDLKINIHKKKFLISLQFAHK